MSDQPNKVVGGKSWEALKKTYEGSPVVYAKLTQLERSISSFRLKNADEAHLAFEQVKKEHPELRAIQNTTLDDFYSSHYGTENLKEEKATTPTSEKEVNSHVSRRARANSTEEGNTKREQEMFLKNPEKTKKMLFYESVGRMVKDVSTCVLRGEDIPPDLLSKAVKRTVIEHYVGKDSPSYAYSEKAVFEQWCRTHSIDARDKKNPNAKKYRRSTEHRYATDDFLIRNLQPHKEINLATLASDVEKKKDEVEAKRFKDPVDRLVLSVTNHYLPAQSEKEAGTQDKETGNQTTELNRRKFLFFKQPIKRIPIGDKDQGKILNFLKIDFRKRLAEYAQKFPGFNALLIKHGIFLESVRRDLSSLKSEVRPQAFVVFKRFFRGGRGGAEQQLSSGVVRFNVTNRINAIADVFRSREKRLKAAKHGANLLSPEKTAMNVLKGIVSPVSSPLTSPWKLAIIVPVLVIILVLFILPTGTGLTTIFDDQPETGVGGTTTSILITKTANDADGKINNGETVAFTINVNYSNISGPITITDPIPVNAGYVPNSCTPSNQCQLSTDGKTVQWTLNPTTSTQPPTQNTVQATDNATLVSWLDSKLSTLRPGSTGLVGMGQALVNSSAQHNVPIELALGQFWFENQWWTVGKTVRENTNNPGHIKCGTDECKTRLGALVGKDMDGYSIFPSLEKGIEAYFLLLDSERYRAAVNDFISTSDPTAVLQIYYAPSDKYGSVADYVDAVNIIVEQVRTAATNDGIVLPNQVGALTAINTVSGAATLTLALTGTLDKSYITNQAYVNNSSVGGQISSKYACVAVGNPPSAPPQCQDDTVLTSGDRAFPVRGITIYDILRYRMALNGRAENNDSGGFYNNRDDHWHAGLDISGPTQASMETGTWYIVSATDGTVDSTGQNSGAGNLIRVKNSDGTLRFSYFHLKNGGILVKTGDQVKAGQVIGIAGDTGNSSAVHLHFEIRPYNNLAYAYDPLPWLVDGSLKDLRNVTTAKP
jgi:hypothetical protein